MNKRKMLRWGAVALSILIAVVLIQIWQRAGILLSLDEPVEIFATGLSRLRGYILQSRVAILQLLLRITYALAATFFYRLSLQLLRRYYPRLYRYVYRLEGRFISSMRIQNIEIINARSTIKSIIFVLRYLRYVIFALIIYLYIPFILNISPWTESVGDLIFNSLTSVLSKTALAVISYIPNLMTLCVIFAISYYFIRFSSRVLLEIEKGRIKIPNFYPIWAKPTSKILIFVVVGLAAVISFPFLPGGNSPVLQGVSVFFGVLFSLGSTTVISNLVSGIVLIYTRAFEKGDRIMIGDISGDVVEETLLVTRIRTTKNKVVTIPNTKVMRSEVVNFSKSSREYQDAPLVVHTTITLGYDVPWPKVHESLIKAANNTAHTLKSPRPFVLQTALNDFYVSYEINVYTNDPRYLEIILSELHQHIQDQLNYEGIEIMSPHYLALRDGNEITLPSKYQTPDYTKPVFNVKLSSNPNNHD